MTWRAGTILSAALLAAQCAPTPAFGQLPQLSVVNLTHPLDSDAMHVAVFGAAGLENRDEPKVYVLRDDDPTSDGALSPPAASRTAFWLQEIVSPKRQLVPTAALAFVQAAVAAHGAVLYDSTNEPWAFTTALTAAAGRRAAVRVGEPRHQIQHHRTLEHKGGCRSLRHRQRRPSEHGVVGD